MHSWNKHTLWPNLCFLICEVKVIRVGNNKWKPLKLPLPTTAQPSWLFSLHRRQNMGNEWMYYYKLNQVVTCHWQACSFRHGFIVGTIQHIPCWQRHNAYWASPDFGGIRVFILVLVGVQFIWVTPKAAGFEQTQNKRRLCIRFAVLYKLPNHLGYVTWQSWWCLKCQ